MQLRISVAGPAEARAALLGGADVIDAKDPRRGALGPVSLQRLAAIRAAVAGARPLSAAVGDATSEEAVAGAVAAALSVGVAFVKPGLAGVASEARAGRLAAAARRAVEAAMVTRLVLVAYADWRSAASLPPARVVAVAAGTGAAGVLLDTATKGVPLFGVESPAAVAAWVAAAHAAGLFAALAGGLSGPDLARARSLGADVVGVRGAACVGGRTGRVSRARVAALIPPSPSTSAASGRRAASACAYWSIPSTAIQCAASSPILTRLNIRRTASANGPPPGSTTSRRPRRNAVRASITSSKAPAVPSNPPPTFTTV